jgi:hypothetical protein
MYYDMHQHYGWICCLYVHVKSVEPETAGSSKMLVPICQTTPCHISKHSALNIHWCGNLISQNTILKKYCHDLEVCVTYWWVLDWWPDLLHTYKTCYYTSQTTMKHCLLLPRLSQFCSSAPKLILADWHLERNSTGLNNLLRLFTAPQHRWHRKHSSSTVVWIRFYGNGCTHISYHGNSSIVASCGNYLAMAVSLAPGLFD